MKNAAESYLRRHALHPPLIGEPPHPGLNLAVVIPSHDEPRLLETLADLWACARPEGAVEVIVVFNAPENAPAAGRERGRALLREANEWRAGREDPFLRFHLLDFPALPARSAGVGLARKLGMDEAVARFRAAERTLWESPIACLDADCRVGPEYLTALAGHFRTHGDSPACAIHFEHDWAAEPDPRLREGIVQYELHLRTVVAGLRLAGYPFPHHTMGSAMAVRAETYCRQGGMNKRKGAEDFYFLAKLMPLGGFSELTATTVVPSGRISHRVPFGTGRAMTDWLAGERSCWPTYAPQSYRDLGALLKGTEAFYGTAPADLSARLEKMPTSISDFLREVNFARHLDEMQRNSASPETFRTRFYRWLDRFRVLRFLHHARERHYPAVPVTEAARTLLGWRDSPSGGLSENGVSPGGLSSGGPAIGGSSFGERADPAEASEAIALLECFRRLDREG